MVVTQRDIAKLHFDRAAKAFTPPWRIDGHDIWQYVPFVYTSEFILKGNRADKVYVSTSNIIKNKKLLSDIQLGLLRYSTGVNMNLPIRDNNRAFPNGVIAKLQETILWQENLPTLEKEFEKQSRIDRARDNVMLVESEKTEALKKQQKIESRNVFTQLTADQAIELTKIPAGETTEQKEQRIFDLQIQDVTFNEQVNSGDYNETPITDINLDGGCSECTGTEISPDPIIKKGYHTMPDGSLMKDTDMEKGNNMKMAGIAAVAIGLGYLILKNK